MFSFREKFRYLRKLGDITWYLARRQSAARGESACEPTTFTLLKGTATQFPEELSLVTSRHRVNVSRRDATLGCDQFTDAWNVLDNKQPAKKGAPESRKICTVGRGDAGRDQRGTVGGVGSSASEVMNVRRSKWPRGDPRKRGRDRNAVVED